MAPDWPWACVAEYFNVSEYMVREARKLAREKGILALPEPKRGKCLSKKLKIRSNYFTKMIFEADVRNKRLCQHCTKCSSTKASVTL